MKGTISQILAYSIVLIALSFSSLAAETDNLSAFVEKSLLEFRSTIIDIGLDPVRDDTVRDLYVINPTLEIGGDIWEAKFFGFSNFYDLSIHSTINFNTTPPYEARGNFQVNYTIPATLTGKYRLSGHLNVNNETRIPLAAEGSWGIEASALRRDINSFWVKDGHLDQTSATTSLTLENAKLTIPGLLDKLEIPTDLVEFTHQKIHEEIWAIFEFEFNLNKMRLQQTKFLDAKFEETPFVDIINPSARKIRTRQSDSIWQLDLFIAKAMRNFRETAAQGLDPLRNLGDVKLNMTSPSYLRLQGVVTNLTFHGIKDIEHWGSYSSPGQDYFTFASDYPTADLAGRHDLTGTITIASTGEVIPVGGIDDTYSLKSRPAESLYRYRYVIDENRRIKLYHPEVVTINLMPYETGYYTVDVGTLFDPITDPALVTNAKYWVSYSIHNALSKIISQRIAYRATKVLQAAFDLTTFDEIIDNPPTN